MAKRTGTTQIFALGIADSRKTGEVGSCQYSRAMDFRSDASQMTVLPRATLTSGSVVKDLPMWHQRVLGDDYFYGNAGRIYKVTGGGTTTQLHVADSAQGNGLAYLGEDKTLYYAQNVTIGRYGRFDQTPSFQDDYLNSIGGEPTNTRSIQMLRASSQFGYVADNADHDITGNLSLQTFYNPTTLPSTGESHVLMSKWNENGNQRSYKLSIETTSNAFGDGGAGNLTISSNTTQAPIDSGCSGTSGSTSLTATNASFASGQELLIVQMRGTNAGTYERNKIASYTAGTITLENPLSFSPNSTGSNKAQVIVLTQYNNVTINSGVTWTAKAWNGTVGGILAFLCKGTLTVNGTISATSRGFVGSGSDYTKTYGFAAEGSAGPAVDNQNTNNGSGGGGAQNGLGSGGGGGGGHASAGSTGNTSGGGRIGGQGGSSVGDSSATTIHMGGGGGGTADNGADQNIGGNGGGIVFTYATTITVNNSTGTITVAGQAGENANPATNAGGAGGGAAGTIKLMCQTATLNTNRLLAQKGSGGTASPSGGKGGDGADGRIAVYYSDSVSGTSTPTMTTVEDSNLAAVDGYALRLAISSNGTNVENYNQDITSLVSTGTWARWTVTWQASTSTAIFYQGATNIGTKTGTLTAIYNSSASLAINAMYNSTAQNFGNGLYDDARIWAAVLSESDIAYGTNRVLSGAEANLKSYYEFESNADDSTANARNLTLSGSPTYSTNVPFSGVSSRKDQDQINDESGQTYTLTTSINEGATHRQTFVPDKDPQKSIIVNIGAKGTGNWTLTVHDPQNNVMASKTIINASVTTGYFEFVFDNVWRPVRGANYHFHLTSTVADGTVVTGTTADLETCYFTSHYQILVSDTYHPMIQMLNFLAIGNERYVAKLEAGDIYDPHRLVLPSGYRVRCLGFWREFLAIGTWRGTSITDEDTSRIFFWDGVADTYNYYLDVPQGAINAMLGTEGRLYFMAGYSGDLMAYEGGERATKIKRFPRLGTDSLEVYPGSMSMWRALLMVGAGVTNSTTFERAVYSYGRLNERLPESFNVEHPTSLGVQTNTNVQIGCVSSGGSSMYIGWKNGNNYGIDVVRPNASPYANVATYESLIVDSGMLSRRNLPTALRCDFEPLQAGQSVTLSYKRDRSSDWVQLSSTNTVGARYIRGNVSIEANEIEYKIDVTCGTTSPVITAIGLEVDDGQKLTV